MAPTEIYVKRFKPHRENIKALAHITGGGIVENLPRALDGAHHAVVSKSAIEVPEVFNMMREDVAESELFRTFNMGVGMVWIVDASVADRVAREAGGYIIGEIRSGAPARVELID